MVEAIAEVQTEEEEEVMTAPTTPEAATTTATATRTATLLDVGHTVVAHQHVAEIVRGTMRLAVKVKTPIRLEPVAREAPELEEHVEPEVGQEVDPEVMAATEEAMATQEVVEEDEAEEHDETTRNRKKLSTNQTQRTARVMLAASKKP